MIIAMWTSAALAVLALANTLLNLWTWPVGRPTTAIPRTSVLIPARNEVGSIEHAVRSAVEAGALEVVVYDDRSTDGTSERLAALDIPGLRVLNGVPLPPGWVGKPHACHRLAQAARGDVLVFMDADVALEPDGLERIVGELEALDADILTAVPQQEMGSAVEQWLMPLLSLTYTAWLPLYLVYASKDPRFLAANGQVIAFDRAAYDRIGGFEAVRAEVVDDMAITRAAKILGLRVVFADGSRIARCRMYTGGRDLWEGFSKNIYEGLGGPLALAFALGLYLVAWVLPWGGLALAPVLPALMWPALLGVGAGLLTRALLAWRFGHRWWSVIAHPTAVLGLVAIALNSWRWNVLGTVHWAGRVYSARAVRDGADV